MKKVLFVATVASHINSFHLPYLKAFRENGYIADVATRKEAEVDSCDNHFAIPFERNPMKPANFKAYKQLKKLIDENEYDIIHCHTPVASILTRLAARKARKSGAKVIYTAHGFHFYKGAPLLNWLIYYPIEKLCARWTDVLITINKEDYALASKKMPAKRVEYVPGVGVDLEKFSCAQISDEEKEELKRNIGVPQGAKLILSVGELNSNKNHSVIISALARIEDENVHYCIAGTGKLEESLKKQADNLGIGNRIHLLGYRTDIAELMQIADIFCFPSHREGLPLSVMEAMASGLPVVCSDVRGNNDLIADGEGRYLCKPKDDDMFAKTVSELISDRQRCSCISKVNRERIESFSSKVVIRTMMKIYQDVECEE